MKPKLNFLSDVPEGQRKLYTRDDDGGYSLDAGAVGRHIAHLENTNAVLSDSHRKLAIRQDVAAQLEAGGSVFALADPNAREVILQQAAQRLTTNDKGAVVAKVGQGGAAEFLADLRRDSSFLFEAGGNSATRNASAQNAHGTKMISRSAMGRNLDAIATGKVIVDPNS